MNLALGPVARLKTRGLYALLQTRFAWCDRLQLTLEVEVKLKFWAESLVSYNAQPIWCSPGAARVVCSDASDVGYGGYTVGHGMHTAHRNWLPEEAQQSSTWRELVAVHRVLEAMANSLQNCRVRWFTDNQNVARLLLVGSRKEHLQIEVLKVFSLCVSHGIHLEPEWIPRKENELSVA